MANESHENKSKDAPKSRLEKTKKYLKNTAFIIGAVTAIVAALTLLVNELASLRTATKDAIVGESDPPEDEPPVTDGDPAAEEGGGGTSAAPPETLDACIRRLRQQLEGSTREEVVRLSLYASRGSLPLCRTREETKEIFAGGPNDGEVLVGEPTCKLLSAKVPERAKIVECATKNKIPFMTASVRGKGCEFPNEAEFQLTAQYQPRIDYDELREKCEAMESTVESP